MQADWCFEIALPLHNVLVMNSLVLANRSFFFDPHGNNLLHEFHQ